MSSQSSVPCCVLDLQSVSYSTRQGKTLIAPLSLQLTAGQNLAIVGPNGAGKSTLLRLMAGTLAPSSGNVLLNGRPLHQLSALERARTVAVLGQNDDANGRLRVIDYVALGCLPHRNHWSQRRLKERVGKSLNDCKLHHLCHQHLAQLSGGERQRAHLARALAQEPQLLLLDEPTNHLDPRATLDLLHGVASLGITVVAVLHDLALVPQWADRVAVMQRGALVTLDAPSAAISPLRVHQVFGMHAFYLPHPKTSQPMLVMDNSAKTHEAKPAARSSFFTHYEEAFA